MRDRSEHEAVERDCEVRRIEARDEFVSGLAPCQQVGQPLDRALAGSLRRYAGGLADCEEDGLSLEGNLVD